MHFLFMKSFASMALISNIFTLMEDGGPFTMTLLLICLLLIIFLIARSLIAFIQKKVKFDSMLSLINSIGLFALVLGVFSPLLHLIETLDQVEAIGEVQAPLIASSFKLTILPTLFGCFIFLLSRGYTITLNWITKYSSWK